MLGDHAEGVWVGPDILHVTLSYGGRVRVVVNEMELDAMTDDEIISLVMGGLIRSLSEPGAFCFKVQP